MATAVEWLHKESNELIIKFLDNEIDMIIFIELYHNNYCKAKEMENQQCYSEKEASELVYNIIGEYAKHYGIMIDGSKLNDLFEKFKNKNYERIRI